MKNQYRFIARIIIEAKSPLNIGSGNKGIKSDSLVLRDINGLPFIPGTTIAGLLRHTLGQDEDKYMGSQQMGSPLIITEAQMIDSDGIVLDGIIPQEKFSSEFLVNFRQLPIRQHAKIGYRGTTVKGGKFDEEIVLKGTRFCFEMEMLSDKDDDTKFKELIDTLNSETFRIGSGSRSGFGEIEVVDSKCQYKKINLEEPEQRKWYLKKSSSLSEEWQDAEIIELKKSSPKGWTSYTLQLKPIDFMLFGSGFGNDKADMTFVRESFVDWSKTPAKVIRKHVVLIPASSVKGALSHRLAFHYNKLKGVFADTLKEGEKIEDHVGNNNEAVKAVFGSEGNKDMNGKMRNKQRGNVLMSDFLQQANASPKILNHVSIDRFTGGAIDGALFNEETLYAKGLSFELKLLVNKSAFEGKDDVKTAFENTLKDLCSGMLPLGGGVNRGNGCFEGTIKITED